ncbi:MAG TPA: carboxypeptidase regulatory-like domain-containing protein [Gammaproteobacteria bacterium]|nr:carboxypeptidase regulatory-like domain-containing protein [Gammaproteobacteria bacterium]
MKTIDRSRAPALGLLAAAVAGLTAAGAARAQTADAESAQAADIALDANDIGGVVKSRNGPEAGVWVIAETNDLDTRFARIVVTDDAGRYVVPDLPSANYSVWVRGYGLADSAKVAAKPGQRLDLEAVATDDPAVAAQVYPAIYWYSLMKLPSESEVAHIDGGLDRYVATMKNLGCVGCHQLGQKATRTLPPSLGKFSSSTQAWTRRLQSGQAGAQMIGIAGGQLQGLPFKYLADWTDRIAMGELPRSRPERPQGVERDIVATVRDWSDDHSYLHDLASTDKREPTVNAYGLLYGSPELSTDEFPILDPVHNTATTFHAPVRDENTPSEAQTPPVQPSPYWGERVIWDSKANSHNPMFDRTGRVWYTARIRAPDNPDFCREGSDLPSAKAFPLERSGRQMAVYDPKTKDYKFIDTCFSTHHLQFGFDAHNTLWTSGGGPVVGWLDTKVFDETGDAAKAQGWTALILDTNGNGKRDEYVEPDQPVNPKLDKRINAPFYAVMPSPVDGSIWGATYGYPGSIVRLDPGPNPPETALAEVYNVPMPGFGSRGADIDSNGVVWVSLGSGHLGSFDRRKCKGPLNGPTATGDHCPEGWSFYRLPGPSFAERPDESVESSYYTWVDQHDTAGLGNDVPIATGNLFDGVHALVNGKFVTLRIPYPLGFYAKGLDGRIDDPSAGWKGRGLWVTSGDRTPWLKEGGKGTKPLVVHFQVRPDPLAK